MNYNKIYDQLIAKARSEDRNKNGVMYYEAHHIIPKCLGGTGIVSQWKTHPNIVLLTAREHFIAHKLLVEIYPDDKKIFYGLWMMYCYKNEYQERYYNYSSTEYERNKIRRAALVSEEKKGLVPWNTGKKLSEEHKRKIGESGKGNKSNLGKKLSEEHKKNISDGGKGKKRSDSTKLKMSESKLGKKRSEEFKDRMREIASNRSEETRKKISDSKKGKTPWNKSIPRTEEEKQKMREGIAKSKNKHDE